jgi:hypothetical protein
MANDFYSDLINTNRGVRQRDALSCTLFILSIIPFILSIVKNRDIKGIKCADNLRVPVLIYADNTMILLKLGSNLNELLRIFETFNRASNACINMTKSVIITVDVIVMLTMSF